MATTIIQPKPFVQWKFKCTTAAQKKDAKKRAKELLSFYLDGMANGLKLANPFYPNIAFQISNEKLVADPTVANTFIYKADVKRVTKQGAIFPSPDATKTPPEPKKPKLT